MTRTASPVPPAAHSSNASNQAFLRDITERKQAQESLQREKERLVALLNSVPDEVWVADDQDRMEMVNLEAAREFGIKILL